MDGWEQVRFLVWRVVVHVGLFVGAMAASSVGYYLVTGLDGVDANTFASGAMTDARDAVLGTGYRLADLKLFDRTRYFVSEKYVDPSRIDPEAMYQAALDAVEADVDAVLFQREPKGRLVHASVGASNTTLVVEPIESMEDLRRELGKVAAVLDKELDVDEVGRREVEYAIINGTLSVLDPHSVLMPPEVSKEMDVENQGEFGGLGITITLRDGRLTVEYPLEDTPAFRAGLKANDRIVRIEDESTVNMTLQEAVEKLRGPVGSPVNIMVMRESFQEPRSFRIVRDVIRLNPVEGELLEGGIGYVRIKSFHANTSRDLDAVLAGFRRDLGGSLKGLVLDLRGNPGGFLTQAVEVADRFLTSGVVVATVASNGRREVDEANAARTEPDYPLAVLTNANSASASEIVAGAIKNQDRGVVIGERTFGKGSVQHLYNNADESKLKLTVAHYLTPGDRSIQSVGIPPDIELVPEVVQWREIEAKDDQPARKEPWITLLWREMVSREADLDRHLERDDTPEERPSYRLPYLFHVEDDDNEAEAERLGKRDLSKDWEVQFAREVLLSCGSARRADMLAAAAPVEERRQQEQAARIRQAFQDLHIDWSAGTQPEKPALKIELDLGPDGMLVPGEEEEISVKVTNEGDKPVFQVFAFSKSDNEWLDENEYFFGKIPPGESRVATRRVKLAHGYPDEVDSMHFLVRDAAGLTLGEDLQMVRVQGQPLPAFSWRLALYDDGSGKSQGDGDGIPEVGEVVDLECTLSNVGEAAGGEVFAKLRNGSGRDVDLREGVVEFGALEPQQTVSGRFTFEVRGEGAAGNLELELQVGDNERFDYGAILRGGFWDLTTQKQKLVFPVAGNPASAGWAGPHAPPSLEISRRPPAVVNGAGVVLSGVVRDDQALRDVIIYHGKKKIYYRGDGALATIPFSVEQELDPGLNTFIILAHDLDGLTLARSVVVYFEDNKVAQSD